MHVETICNIFYTDMNSTKQAQDHIQWHVSDLLVLNLLDIFAIE